jgi:hypothetical protein
VPVVVVTHAASSPTRDLPLYRHLIELLPTLGVAAFVYDRRGSGASGGEARRERLPTLADDAIAAQRMLEKLPAVDPRRIGFWGLSQEAGSPCWRQHEALPTAFVISVSAPMTTPDAQMNFAVANLLSVEGYSHADVEQAVGARPP